jgi:hypothetical protein
MHNHCLCSIMVWFTSLLGLAWITTSCLVYFWAFYKSHVDVRIWYEHCLRLTLVNPILFIVVLLNIKGWTCKLNIILWSCYPCSNNPLDWKTPSLLQTTIVQGTTLALSMVGCIRNYQSLVTTTCQHGVFEIYVWLALDVLWVFKKS